MDSFNSESGRKVAEAIDRRVMNVAKNIYENSPNNKTKFGTVLSSNAGLFSVKIDNVTYTNITALRNVGDIKRGEVVVCLIPNNQYSNMIILGVADGTLASGADIFMPKTGGTFTGNVILNSDTKLQSQSLLSPSLNRYNLIWRNEKGYVEVGNSEDELQLFGNLSMPTYNGNSLALESDVTAALNVRTILNTQTLTANKGSWYNQFATITPIWTGSTYKKQYDFYGSIGGLGQGTVTITVPVTMSSLRNLTCGSSGEWKNWERVNAVRIAFTSNTTFAITISDDQGSAHNVDFHLTFIND